MKDIDLYDSAKAITRSCEAIDAVIAVMEEAEENDDGDIQKSCLMTARCALTAIVAEIRSEAKTIAEKTADETV